MARMTRADLERICEQLRRDNQLLTLYLFDSTQGCCPDATERCTYDDHGERVSCTLHLYRAASPCGGYVVRVYRRHDGMHTQIDYLDHITRNPYLPFEEQYAINRLVSIRNRIMCESIA